MLPENAEAMHELQMGVQKFVNTYVYIRGFNSYTVDKIQHMYGKAYRVSGYISHYIHVQKTYIGLDHLAKE